MEIVVANIRNFQFECERSNGISVLPDYESVEQVSIFDYVIFVDYFGHFLWDFLDGRYTEYFLFDYVYCRQYVNTINFLNTKQHKSVNENITKHLKLYLFGVRSQSPWPTHHCLWVCWMFFFVLHQLQASNIFSLPDIENRASIFYTYDVYIIYKDLIPQAAINIQSECVPLTAKNQRRSSVTWPPVSAIPTLATIHSYRCVYTRNTNNANEYLIQNSIFRHSPCYSHSRRFW